ncbi:EI24 domain-containing protein [Agrococcus citreus]|uniref:EI24 domain-containing protein n=1 Tax=Agrococcus citreus TaxID=84643 RepID=A0ABP4JDE9_9MICO
MRQRLSELLAGAGLLLRGFATWSRDPGLMLLGAVPALLVGLVMLGLLILLGFQVGGWATALTPFADGWDRVWADVLRTALALGMLVGAIVLCVLTFAAITLTVGEPFYERISRSVEARLGGVQRAPDEGFWRSVGKGLRDGIALLGMAVGTALVVFVVGLIPLVGTVLGLVTGALLGGRALARELTGIAGDARGMTLAERRALLAEHRWRSLGFGMVAYLLLLVPGLAVVATPAAIVGGTLLVRDLRGEPTTPAADQGLAPGAADPGPRAK